MSFSQHGQKKAWVWFVIRTRIATRARGNERFSLCQKYPIKKSADSFPLIEWPAMETIIVKTFGGGFSQWFFQSRMDQIGFVWLF